MNQTILIVGGGLGGLALAQGLLGSGFTVRVVERDRPQRLQGRRLSINKIGLEALRQLLPQSRLAELSAVEVADLGRDFHFASPTLRPLVRFAAARDGVGAITVRRGGLHALLARGLDIEHERQLVALDEDGAADARVVARFAAGPPIAADYVVGADGIRSVVRAQLAAARAGDRGAVPELVMTDIVVVGGTVARTAAQAVALPLLRAGAVQCLGRDGTALFVSRLVDETGQSRVLWALARRDPTVDATALRAQSRTPAGRAALLADAIARVERGAWHAALRDLVRATDGDDVVDPIVVATTRVPKPSARTMSRSGRVTLLGDAAHAMPPYRGLGANHAFADGARLATLLRRPSPNWRRLTLTYEREMLARARIAVDESEETARLCTLGNPLGRWLRDGVLRAIGLVTRVRPLAVVDSSV